METDQEEEEKEGEEEEEKEENKEELERRTVWIIGSNTRRLEC